jgi:hypothetical protein
VARCIHGAARLYGFRQRKPALDYLYAAPFGKEPEIVNAPRLVGTGECAMMIKATSFSIRPRMRTSS